MNIFGNLCRPAFAESPTGQIEYKDFRVNKSGNNVLEGIDLSSYHFVMIYSYIFIKPNTLFVMGSKETKNVEMIAISMKEQTSILIARYPSYLRWSLRTANFSVFFMQKLKSPATFIVLKYLDGNIARQIDETITLIDIYFSESGSEFKMINSQKVSESNIAYYRHTNMKYKYLYVEVDNSFSGIEPLLGPAKKMVPKYFINDVNNDGYSDILIWKAFYISRKIEEEEKKDFVLDREELYVMYFNYWDLTFSKPTPIF